MKVPLSKLLRSLKVKKGVKQNLLILRPLWHCSEGIKQLVKGSFLVQFWLPKNEHIFSPYKQWIPHQVRNDDM